MKKIAFFMSALALAFAFTACDKDNGAGEIDWENLTLDGFYVYGPATGSDKVMSVNAMAAGSNEVKKAVRPGMYEKYIYLEAGKEFALVDNKAGELTYYGANLAEVNYGKGTEENPGKNFAYNPNMMILQGKLIVGQDAPKMKVSKSALYHIVLDNNSEGDLAFPQIVVQEATWGVRGGMNGWGFTEGTPKYNEDGSIVYTWTEQQFDTPNGAFKFASCHGWKINLDEDNVVKAEVAFGVFEGKLNHVANHNDIKVEKSGRYTITLTYKPAAGALTDAFSYTIERTGDAVLEFPQHMYINGAEFGGDDWSWDAETIGEMIPVVDDYTDGPVKMAGHFYAVRYLHAGKELKVAPEKNWDNSYGFDFNNSNMSVDADGLYMIYVNYPDSKISITPAVIYGYGDAFGGWETPVAATVNADGTVSVATSGEGVARMYVDNNLSSWWTREFGVKEGKIFYRGLGNDVENNGESVASGKTITLDFWAGTATIQ